MSSVSPLLGWGLVVVYLVSCFVVNFVAVVLTRRRILCRVISRFEVLCLPICAHKTAGRFKVGGEVDVFLSALELRLDSAASESPLVQDLLCFLISALLSELSVLMVKPGSL